MSKKYTINPKEDEMKTYRHSREGGKPALLKLVTISSSFRATTRHPAFKLLSRLFTIFGLVMMFTLSSWAAATAVSGVNAVQLAAAVQGPGITISNPVLRTGKSSQAGTFSNGITGAHLEIDEGIILTGMSVAESVTTNSSWQTSISNEGSATDADLLAIDPKAKYDTVVFEFDVTLGANTRLLMVDYQFASEEYNEYVGSQFNDAFGFFVSGGDLSGTYNIARVVDDSTIVTTANIANYAPVTVNNVNNGTLGAYADGTSTILTNTQYFINNCVKGSGVPSCTQTKAPVDVEYDGLTHRLHATLDNLTPGETYHFKMALADTGDAQWDTGVFVNKIMGVRGPQLCYDYAYKQNDQFITDKSYIGQIPTIKSSVLPNNNVEVSMYIKNQEVSELIANNLKISVNDINTTQAIYTPQSVNVILPNSIMPVHIADNSAGMTVADGYIHNIPIGDLKATEYFYTKYGLTPSVSDLNMSLNATVSFDLNIQGVTIPYTYTLGSDKLPMCVNQVLYSPGLGIFNMVDQRGNTGGEFNVNSTSVKNNLPTQVANRPTVTEIVSYNPTNLNQVKASNTMLAVEIIDVGGYFDINASCADPSSAITPRAWVQFGDVDSNVTHTSFSNVLLGTGLNSSVSSASFYQNVRENLAYRLNYNMGDDNGTMPIDKLNSGQYKLTNFPSYAGNECHQGFIPPSGNSTQIPTWCGSNGQGGGNNGMTASELQTCMECIFGLKTKSICSRDNFSIRPEAFNVHIKDPTGLISLPVDANLSAGYLYRFDVNATNHIDSNATSGYVAQFKSSNVSPDRNVTLYWSPNGNIVTGCNDVSSPSLDFYFLGGAIVNQARSYDNVGRYELKIRDTQWTKVDQSPSHHIGNTNWITGNDCNVGDAVPIYNSSNSYADNMVGCEISSSHKKLSSPTVTYNDYNLTFKPYKFNLALTHGLGIAAAAVPVGGGFVYDADLNNTNDMNMSVRSSGIISAVGFNGGNLSNFVKECYAKDLSLTLAHNATLTLATPFVARMVNYDANNTTIQTFDSEEMIVVPGAFTTVDDSNFTKNAQGSIQTILRFNYDRNITTPLDPQSVAYTDINVTCAVNSQCSRQADGVVGDANGTSPMNFNVMHGYGRYHPTNIKVYGNSPFSELSYMEVFNAPTINGTVLTPSRFNAGWFINNQHTGTNLGEAFIDIREGSIASQDDVNSTINVGNATYLMLGQTPTYRARAHVNTEGWLWHGMGTGVYTDPVIGDSLVQCNNHPCFYIDVLPVIGRAGSAETDGGSKANKSSGSTNETGWQSTSEYAPAIR